MCLVGESDTGVVVFNSWVEEDVGAIRAYYGCVSLLRIIIRARSYY